MLKKIQPCQERLAEPDHIFGFTLTMESYGYVNCAIKYILRQYRQARCRKCWRYPESKHTAQGLCLLWKLSLKSCLHSRAVTQHYVV